MPRHIKFSRTFPAYHPKAGQPTYFVEKFLKSWDITHFFHEIANAPLIDHRICDFIIYESCLPKSHTIRSGHRWKKGDYFQPSVWGTDINLKSGRSGAYHSKSINIAPPTLIVNEWPIIIASEGFSIVVYINEIAVAQFKIHLNREIVFDFGYELVCKLAKNDGLETQDLIHWFTMSPDFKKTGLFDGQIICYNENLKY